jgi:hypothetical protein
VIFLFSVKDLVKFRLGAADSRGHNRFLTDVKVHPSLYLSIFHFFPSNSLRFCRHCIEMSTASRAPRIPADIPPASSTSMRLFHYSLPPLLSPPPRSGHNLVTSHTVPFEIWLWRNDQTQIDSPNRLSNLTNFMASIFLGGHPGIMFPIQFNSMMIACVVEEHFFYNLKKQSQQNSRPG